MGKKVKEEKTKQEDTQVSNRKTLLIPVDFSQTSKEALKFAGKLAGSMDADLLVLHVIHDPENKPGFYRTKGKPTAPMSKVAEDMMKEFLDKARNSNPDIKAFSEAESMLVTGLPITQILNVAKDRNVHMIIMGSQGRTGLSHFLLGSKVERVVQLSTIPVTVVKSKKTKKVIEKELK